MWLDADAGGIAGIERREPARIDRDGVGGMIGKSARSPEPRHVCKIGEFTRRFECADEGGKFVAIGCEQRRARWPLEHEDARHRREEFFAYDSFDRGETVFE